MRVENLGTNVDEYCSTSGEGSSTFDVCKKHGEQLQRNPHAFNDILAPYNHKEPDGDAGRGGDIDHPDYDDDPGNYRCCVCDVVLTDAKDS